MAASVTNDDEYESNKQQIDDLKRRISSTRLASIAAFNGFMHEIKVQSDPALIDAIHNQAIDAYEAHLNAQAAAWSFIRFGKAKSD